MAPHHQIKSSRRTLLIMDEDHPKSKWRIHQRKIFYSCKISLKYIFSRSLKVFLNRKQTFSDLKISRIYFLSETSDQLSATDTSFWTLFFLSFFKCMGHRQIVGPALWDIITSHTIAYGSHLRPERKCSDLCGNISVHRCMSTLWIIEFEIRGTHIRMMHLVVDAHYSVTLDIIAHLSVSL